MKKAFFVFLIVGGSLTAMIRAGVSVPPPDYDSYDDDYYYYNTWYGPGVYYGVYYNDYPTWQRDAYYRRGPYWDGHDRRYRREKYYHHHH